MANNPGPGGGLGYGGFGYHGGGGPPPVPPPRQHRSHWLAWAAIIGGLVGAYLRAPAATPGGRLRWVGGQLLGLIAVFYAIVFGLKALILGSSAVTWGVSFLPGGWWSAGAIAGAIGLVVALCRGWLRLLVTTRAGRITLITLGVIALWTLFDYMQSGLGVQVALVALILYKVRGWRAGRPFP